MMQRKLLIHEAGVKANKIIKGWTCFHGSGPMPAPGWAPGALVTIFTVWGWHPDLSQKPGWGLPCRHNSRENMLINSRADSSFWALHLAALAEGVVHPQVFKCARILQFVSCLLVKSLHLTSELLCCRASRDCRFLGEAPVLNQGSRWGLH